MDYKDLLRLFKKRVSVRRYLKRRVSDKDINKIIEAARWAPTSCNRQCWKVIVVRKGSKVFDLLAKANHGGIGFANCASVLLLIVVDLRSYWMPREMNFPINDGSIVASYIMLASASVDLATCWISWQASFKIKKQIYKKLNLKPYFYPICVLALGYPEGLTKGAPREKGKYFLVS